MVDRLDQGALPRQDFSNSYTSLYKLVQKALYRTHVEGQLKGDIIQDPASYVELDPDMAKTLMDQRQAVCLFYACNNGEDLQSHAYLKHSCTAKHVGQRNDDDCTTCQA